MPGSRAERQARTVDGIVEAALPNEHYRVEIRGGRRILAHVTGTMRLNFVRILPGDRVTIEVSPFDPGRGRIVSRN
ncbi:MAG: translation initiation factor IF-1 [Planctomycetes bacterium]|nr:translation initiation factor IF-1 [Planctomycetota bacterium]